jgi:hypothetical protein
MEITELSALDVYLVDAIKMPLGIPRESMDKFLSILWDILTSEIGAVTCQHHIVRPPRGEKILYRVRWVDNEFEAALDFHAHTSRGMQSLELRVLERSLERSAGFHSDRILAAAQLAKKRTIEPSSAPELAYIINELKAETGLCGNYHFKKTGIILFNDRRDGRLLMAHPVPGNESQRGFAQSTKELSEAYLAALTVLTQHIFLISPGITFTRISEDMYNLIIEENSETGTYVDDDELFSLTGASTGMTPDTDGAINVKSASMIDRNSFMTTDGLCFPRRTDLLLDHIASNQKRRQAANRFRDGLRFRRLRFSQADGDLAFSYELLAYVAAIEALLDHAESINETACTNCNAPVPTKSREIGKRFRRFVLENGGSEIMSDHYKELYEHRSKFVHTGMSINIPIAPSPNRPLLLQSRVTPDGLPGYYAFIDEWTGFMLRVNFYRTAFQEQENTIRPST